jgi:hypothetical protein
MCAGCASAILRPARFQIGRRTTPLTPEKTDRVRLLLAVKTRELKTALFWALADRPDVQIAATATNTGELLKFNRAFLPGAIALEWEMTGKRPADVLLALAHENPSVVVWIICKPSAREPIRALDPAAVVFEDPEDLVGALDTFSAGGPQSSVSMRDGPHEDRQAREQGA